MCSQSSVLETGKLNSLEIVATRLEQNASPMDTRTQQRHTILCQCLQMYADVICKLQLIEKRQQPVQVDILLTCANLVSATVESQFECTRCLHDPCVTVQLVMIFQKMLSWFHRQCHSPDGASSDIHISIGQYLTTKEEYSIIKSTLLSKALERIRALLRLTSTRIERATLDPQVNEAWTHQGESWDLQKLVASLLRNFGVLAIRLQGSS